MVAEAPIWILLLLPLLVLGGFAALVALVVLAIVNNRLGTVAAIGGLLLLLLGVGALSLIGYRSAAFVPERGQWHVSPANFEGNFQSDFDFNQGPNPIHVNGRISVLGLLFLVALPLLLLFALFRRGTANKPHGQRCGGRGWVPAVVILGLVVLVGLVSAKWFAVREASRHARAARVAEDVVRMHAEVERQQMKVHRQAAEMNDKMQRQIAEMNIHELMDKVDAPRIPLPPAMPSAPQPPAPAAVAVIQAEAAEASAATETKAEESNVEPNEEQVDAGLAAEVQAALAVIAEDEKSAGASTESSTANSDSTPDDADAAKQNSAATDDAQDAEDESWTGEADRAAEKPQESAESTKSEDKGGAAEAAEQEAAAVKEVGSSPADAKLAASEAASPVVETAAAQISNEPRPNWVDRQPKRTGDTWREVVETEEYADANECYAAANVYLLIKTYEHLQMLVGNQSYVEELPLITFSGDSILADGSVISHDRGKTLGWGDGRLLAMRSLGIGIDYVRREIVPDGGEYLETVERSFGPMKKLYTQMEFTPSVDRELRRLWEAHEREERLAVVGVGAGGILGLLGMAYGLLKVDTWTKGYYTKRLFLGVPAAIIGLVTLFALMVS